MGCVHLARETLQLPSHLVGVEIKRRVLIRCGRGVRCHELLRLPRLQPWQNGRDLVDIVGLDVEQTGRDAAFCSHAILPEAPSPFVVLDALLFCVEKAEVERV